MKAALREIVLSLTFTVIVGAQAALGADSTTGAVFGNVRAASGTPIVGATISIQSASSRYSALTDRRGQFAVAGVAAGIYAVTAGAAGYEPASLSAVRVLPGQDQRETFVLVSSLQTIKTVRSRSAAFDLGSAGDTFSVGAGEALATSPTAASDGLATYTQGTVQGAIAHVPGVDLDQFANAILRAGRVSDTVFDYDSVPIPQGLIVEPGGNVDGAQLPTTGVASTSVTLAGYANETDNALGGVVNEIPAIGTYPGSVTSDYGVGIGGAYHFGNVLVLDASPDLKWRYAFATTFNAEKFSYGDGHSFYPSEAATYGLGLADRSEYSLETNVRYAATPRADLSVLALMGQAVYDQYGSPYPGETIGAFDGTATTYPGETDPNQRVDFASGVRGSYALVKMEWQHRAARTFYRVQLYQSATGSTAGGPFWDENGFPDGSISLSQASFFRQYGLNVDGERIYGTNQLRFGAEYRIQTSYLNEVVPTADEFITSNPTIDASLAYLADTWDVSNRLTLSGAARFTGSYIRAGAAYTTGALDPHLGVSYRVGADYAVRLNFDRISVAPAPLEVDRTDSANVRPDGSPAPFVQLAPETANDFTVSFEGGKRVRFRLTYYDKSEKNLIDVLPYDFHSAVAAGLNPTGVGVPSNAGDLRAKGAELYVNDGPLTLSTNYVRAFSSSASQFAYNDLNAPAVAAGHLFPVGYEPNFTAQASYSFTPNARWHITPSLSYSTGYPYGNGKMVWVFDPATGKPEQVPNDNHVNPGANYYFLANPALPFNALTNPYIGNLGTGEGSDPNTLRSPGEFFVNLEIADKLSSRITAILDVANALGNAVPTAYQSNPYLIGPPGYAGGDPLYARYYQGLIGSARPYALGNGVPTNDGATQALPWRYGSAGYVPQSYPFARSWQLRLQYRF